MTPYYLTENPQGSVSIFDIKPEQDYLNITTDYTYRQGDANYNEENYFSNGLDYISSGLNTALSSVKNIYTDTKNSAEGIFDSWWKKGLLSFAFFVFACFLSIYIIKDTLKALLKG